MLSKWNLDLNLECSNCTTSHRKNTNNRNYLSRKTSRRDISNHQDHQWHPLLCQQERWEIMTNTGLQIPQPMDDQEHLPTTTHIGNHGQDQGLWSKILHQIWCLMGIQQCMHQRWWSIESGIQNQPQIIWTNGHVLWIMQLPFNISSNDEQHSQIWNQRRVLHHIHGWHPHFR